MKGQCFRRRKEKEYIYIYIYKIDHPHNVTSHRDCNELLQILLYLIGSEWKDEKLTSPFSLEQISKKFAYIGAMVAVSFSCQVSFERRWKKISV